MTATVVPLHAQTVGPPHWLGDKTIVARAVEAKQTPPSRDFWRQLAELAQLGAAVVEGRASDDYPRRAGDLLDALSAEIDTPRDPNAPTAVNAVSLSPGAGIAGTPEPLIRHQPQVPSRSRFTHGDPSTRNAPGERVQPSQQADSHVVPLPDREPAGACLARLQAGTSRLARVLADPREPDLRHLASVIDDFAVALHTVLRHRTPVSTRENPTPGRHPPW